SAFDKGTAYPSPQVGACGHPSVFRFLIRAGLAVTCLLLARLPRCMHTTINLVDARREGRRGGSWPSRRARNPARGVALDRLRFVTCCGRPTRPERVCPAVSALC